jgi:23S rRNA (uracil1939-C5)-methyltransferase
MSQSSPPASEPLLRLSIGGLNHEGQGVARPADGGPVVFVDQALPGEEVLARVTHRARRHLQAELVEILTAAPARRRSPCILAGRCGGCSVQHLDDASQASWKQDMVEQALRRIGGLEPPMRPILAAPEPLGYRNRTVIPLERREGGPLRAGFYRRGSHRIVNMNRCPVLDPRLDRLIAPLKHDLQQSGWPVDGHLEQGGGLRQLALRLGHHTGELLLTLIASHAELPDLELWARRWLERWPELVGVCLNLQPDPGNTLFGARTLTVAGRPWLLERFAGLALHIGPDTFFQVHTTQAERLVPLIHEALEPAAGTRLLDAYCGIGTFSLPLAAAGASVLGIEQQESSVERARENAALNGLDTARFLAQDVAADLPSLLAESDGVLLDPPRKGLPAWVCDAIAATPPRRLAYLSCNPSTLARDLARLTAGSALRLLSVQPVDFFPQTSHVETLAVLDRPS